MTATKPPMHLLVLAALCGLMAASAARAGDVSGQWRAEFDTQVGQQKYLFTFQVNEGKVTGKATAEFGGQKREVQFKEEKLAGDTLRFVEFMQSDRNRLQRSNSPAISCQFPVETGNYVRVWRLRQMVCSSAQTNSATSAARLPTAFTA